MSPEEFSSSTGWREQLYQATPAGIQFRFSGGYSANLFHEISSYALVASQIAQQQSFDVIHAHDWLTFPAGIAAKRLSGKPLVLHVHATEFDRSGDNINQHVYDIERQGLEAADHIIAVSHYTKDIIIKKYGISPGKITTVHNGVIEYENGKPAVERMLKEKIVTFMGRVTFQKGPDYFVEAARRVLEKNRNVRFVIAGNGDMMQRMIKRVAELRIGSRFHFTGFLQGEKVDRLLAITDVFVMPSVSEPFGIVPLEALRAGVPVIISKQSGVSEVLKNAIKLDFWDIEKLSDSITALIRYPAIAKVLARNGAAEVANLRWEDAAGKVKEVYHQFSNN
jgi:glycosyltransferase involved in cell wall biosynthesis